MWMWGCTFFGLNGSRRNSFADPTGILNIFVFGVADWFLLKGIGFCFKAGIIIIVICNCFAILRLKTRVLIFWFSSVVLLVVIL